MEAQAKVTVCQICETCPSKYMCPRCGVPYCSLSCYRNESKHLQCSESFYRDCVVENIKTEEQQNPESAKKMQQVLQRFHEQYNQSNKEFGDEDDLEELDSDDDEPLDKRLAGIDLDNAEAVWTNLTEEEQREFQNIVKNIDVAGELIPEWIPWWYDEPEKTLVVELSDDNKEVIDNTEDCQKLHKRQPDILNPIPVMSELTRVQPNQHVSNCLLNVVAAYVWTSRIFNGDLFDTEKLMEIASSIIHLSSFLKRDGLFKNIEHAVADVPLNACQVPILSEGGTSLQANLNRDVWLIIKGPKLERSSSSSSKSYLLSALTECYLVFCRAVKQGRVKTTKTSEMKPDETFSKVFPAPPPVLSAEPSLFKKAKRKLLYLLAFGNEFMDSASLKNDC